MKVAENGLMVAPARGAVATGRHSQTKSAYPISRQEAEGKTRDERGSTVSQVSLGKTDALGKLRVLVTLV